MPRVCARALRLLLERSKDARPFANDTRDGTKRSSALVSSPRVEAGTNSRELADAIHL